MGANDESALGHYPTRSRHLQVVAAKTPDRSVRIGEAQELAHGRRTVGTTGGLFAF